MFEPPRCNYALKCKVLARKRNPEKGHGYYGVLWIDKIVCTVFDHYVWQRSPPGAV
jgi:hypothetical protein